MTSLTVKNRIEKEENEIMEEGELIDEELSARVLAELNNIDEDRL